MNWVNSSPPSVAYICQWIGSALVQIMACGICGAIWPLGTNVSDLSVHENASENIIYEMAAILSRVGCVNIGSCNGLSPVWRQTIIWTNFHFSPIRPQGRNCDDIWIEMKKYRINNIVSKMCSSLEVWYADTSGRIPIKALSRVFRHPWVNYFASNTYFTSLIPAFFVFSFCFV